MTWHIPLIDLDYGPEEEAAVLRVLKTKWLSMGPETKAFEEEFAASVGTKHAIAVSNGTAALHLAFLALGIGPGETIIQPAVNFVASANMTKAVGATPLFADINSLDEPTLSPESISHLLSSISPTASAFRPKAVVVMHYGGHCCRMAEIQKICRQHNLALAYHLAGGPADNCIDAGAAGHIAEWDVFSAGFHCFIAADGSQLLLRLSGSQRVDQCLEPDIRNPCRFLEAVDLVYRLFQPQLVK